jgi:hypothetical protein
MHGTNTNHYSANTEKPKEKKAIVFLCKTPHKNTIDFAVTLGEQQDFDIYIVVDDMTPLETVENVRFIQISDIECITTGYFNSNINDSATHIKKNPIAWDKFCLHFCEKDKSYDYVWVFEDDVFIPSADTIRNLHEGYSKYDLVVPNNECKEDLTVLDWHWKHIIGKTRPPFHYSMVCAMGLSKGVLKVVREYVFQRKTLFYIEVMFNTLSMQRGLHVIAPLELKSIVWEGEWDMDEFIQLPNNVFHPRKDIENHPKLREQIIICTAENYIPQKELPQFILNVM